MENAENTKKRILHVEDEPSIRSLIERGLSNYNVISTETLEESLDKLKDSKFDACISDGTFPASKDCGPCKDAWKILYREIRKSDKEIQFILCTTNNYSKGELKSFTNNDKKFMLFEKPFYIDDIKKYLSEFLG